MSKSTTRTTRIQMRVEEIPILARTERELTGVELFVLTCTLGGLQVVWSILNGNINVYLLSIGFPASVSPLVWLVAPLCGAFVQPYAGWVSDRTESKYGRRKPFIWGGTLGTVLALVALSWSHDVGRLITTESNAATVTAVLAVLCIIVLNVSIQPLQMAIRALVMDASPKLQQPQANAWASGAASIGNVFGYLISFAVASTSLETFEINRFKYLASLASLCLVVTVTINLWLSKEPVQQAVHPAQEGLSVWSLVHHFRHVSLVSPRTKTINKVQFCAWMGWFPFLFYMTTFVSEVSKRSEGAVSAGEDASPGALAGFLYASISCFVSLLIPHLLRKPGPASMTGPHDISGSIVLLLGVSLERVWFAGSLGFGLLMFATLVAWSTDSAVTLIAVAGIPWALANYIPFALLGIEVADQRNHKPGALIDHAEISEQEEEEEEDSNSNDHTNTSQLQFGTGATVGLHNAAISAPQILAALISSGIFAISEKLSRHDGVDWVLRLGGVAAIVAAWKIKKLFAANDSGTKNTNRNE